MAKELFVNPPFQLTPTIMKKQYIVPTMTSIALRLEQPILQQSNIGITNEAGDAGQYSQRKSSIWGDSE